MSDEAMAVRFIFKLHSGFRLGHKVCLEMAADIKHRIVIQARLFPQLLCWLIRVPPRQVCAERQECARSLLEASTQEIGDVSCCKLRKIFMAELTDCARTGQICEAPFEFLLSGVGLGAQNMKRIFGKPSAHGYFRTLIVLQESG